MAYANGIISAPVSIYDIQRAIGVSSKYLGTLCKSNNINMWAKWKPVSKNIIDTMSQLNSDKTWKTDAQLGTAAWWRTVEQRHHIDKTISIGTIITLQIQLSDSHVLTP